MERPRSQGREVRGQGLQTALDALGGQELVLKDYTVVKLFVEKIQTELIHFCRNTVSY